MQDRLALPAIAGISVAVVAAVGILLLGRSPESAGGEVSALPGFNALLNGASAVLLASGYAFVRTAGRPAGALAAPARLVRPSHSFGSRPFRQAVRLPAKTHIARRDWRRHPGPARKPPPLARSLPVWAHVRTGVDYWLPPPRRPDRDRVSLLRFRPSFDATPPRLTRLISREIRRNSIRCRLASLSHAPDRSARAFGDAASGKACRRSVLGGRLDSGRFALQVLQVNPRGDRGSALRAEHPGRPFRTPRGPRTQHQPGGPAPSNTRGPRAAPSEGITAKTGARQAGMRAG
jgi:hypothetical protein